MFRVTAVLLALAALPQASGTITIHARADGPRIPASLYGIFFEEINHAGEGGLYAELIQNRGFEDARLPPACRLENGFLIPPRTEHFWSGKPSDWKMPWTVTSDTPGWTLVADRASAAIALESDEPLTEASPHSLRLDVTRIDPAGRAAVVNEGFWGVGVRDEERYRLSFYARTDGRPRAPVTASLEGSAGVLATATIPLRTAPGWQRYEAVLTASRTDPRARFVLAVADAGRIWFDFVSLFPSRTWRDRPNGMRPDLAEMIAGLKPAFVRWPGGCFVEGL